MRLKFNSKHWRAFAYLVVLSGLVAAAYFGREAWLPLLENEKESSQATQQDAEPVDEPKILKLGEQARANLDLVSRPVTLQTYWRTIQIPGVVMDRAGVTDRGITSPLDSVVTQVHAFEGDIIQPGQRLFTLRLVSEPLQQTQSELFKAIRETEILNNDITRLDELVRTGVVPRKRMIELNQAVSRQAALIAAHRQDLLSRGLSSAQLEQVESGNFLTTLDVFAPSIAESANAAGPTRSTVLSASTATGFFEIQNLEVVLGQQVSAGQVLAVLANHGSLYVKGHAFRNEASGIARATENNWSVRVEFAEDTATDWPPLVQDFRIRHLANTTDEQGRTFDFFIPLANQSRVYEKEGRPFVVWRFRPGQRVRIHVPLEKIENVIVLPAAAVTREGPEALVFQQNGDLFRRISVQVLHQDRSSVVIANDGTLQPGFFLAQGSAASLNRVLKAQAASGMRADVHVHADGTTHAAH